MLEFVGVTAMDTRVAEVTVSVADPTTLPDVAVIVDEPAATDVANPLEPAALLMAAIVAADDFQVTDVVRFCVVLSEYVPVAVNCLDVPSAKLVLVGVTAIETSVAGVTVSVALPETLPEVAVIVDEPAATEVVKPFEPAALLMAATAVLDDFQVFYFSGDGPHCFKVMAVNYGSPGTIQAQIRTKNAGSRRLEGYVLYIRDGKIQSTNVISIYFPVIPQ